MSRYGFSPYTDSSWHRAVSPPQQQQYAWERVTESAQESDDWYYRRLNIAGANVERTPRATTPRSSGGLTSTTRRANSTSPSYRAYESPAALRPTRLMDQFDADEVAVVQRSTPTRAFTQVSPSMVADPCATFIPPPLFEDRGKVTVVLDLDETLIFARDGPITVRPGVDALLSRLKNVCELVVWTAGEKDYAQEVIRKIDPHRAIKHCVFRHRKWWTGLPGYTKNLNALGRPLHRTLIIENTPDCVKDQPGNAILVSDFLGRRDDDVLYDLLEVLETVAYSASHHHVSDVVAAHPHVIQRTIPCDTSGHVHVFTLRRDNHAGALASRNYDLRPRHRVR